MGRRREGFRELVQKELKRLTREQAVFFAWLCGVRAAPFLGTKGHFKYWGEDVQRHLFAVLLALDVARSACIRGAAAAAATAAAYDADAAKAAAAAAAAAAYARAAKAAAAAAKAAAAAATAAAAAAAAKAAAAAAKAAAAAATAAAAAAAAKAAAAAAKAAAHAAYAAYDVYAAANICDINIEPIILQDLDLIRTGRTDGLQHDTAIYGPVWDNFQAALRDIGCAYWGKLYERLFAKGFILDDEEKEALERRLNVPEEVRDQGAKAVAGYLENAESQGTVYTRRETRLIILGSAGAGKTTLVRRLNGDMTYPKPRDSTHGVDTSVGLDFSGTKAHVWDFGGQVIYHASHRCFMSANCVYVLVVNARTEDNRDSARINYWLDTIRVYSDNKARVFIVLNESDGREQNSEDYGSFKDGEYASLVQEIYSFNIGADMASVTAFKQELAAYIEAIGHQAFGKKDSAAMETIKSLFDQKRKLLETGELEKILNDSGIQKNDQKRAKELFNTLGVALSYDFMKGYVLDPYWISHGVYKVIDYLQKSKSMFIRDNELDAAFTDERGAYPAGKREYILQLMDHHKIGFRNEGGVRGLIVPCAASQFKPRDVIVDVEPDSLVTQVEREDMKEFPADFFYRYICANKDDIRKNGEKWRMWQTGMVLGGERASALVELIENRRIEITVWGGGRTEYSKRLESLINDLLQEYHFTSYEDKRKKGGKLVNFIGLLVESAFKGVTKELMEKGAGGVVR